MKTIKRSELCNIARRNNLDSNTYIEQIIREYPDLIIEDDFNDFKNQLRRECTE